MFNFNFYTPTRVVFGKETEYRIGKLVKNVNCKKVLLHYGSGSVIRSGLLGRIKESLDASGVTYVELGGVVPNPRLSLVRKGIELCRKEGADFLLALGGGSVIDSAKAIGYGLANDGDVWDFYEHTRQASACLPIGVVLTIAASGSEMSNSSVITNDETLEKRGYNNDISRPVFAVMNPEITMTLPPYQTACGCTDILMHTMERYFTNGGNMEITDAIAEGLMRTVITNAKILVDDPDNYDARAEVMWSGSLSHNGLTGCGTGGGKGQAAFQLAAQRRRERRTAQRGSRCLQGGGLRGFGTERKGIAPQRGQQMYPGSGKLFCAGVGIGRRQRHHQVCPGSQRCAHPHSFRQDGYPTALHNAGAHAHRDGTGPPLPQHAQLQCVAAVERVILCNDADKIHIVYP